MNTIKISKENPMPRADRIDLRKHSLNRRRNTLSTSTQTCNQPASGLKQKQSASTFAVQSGPSFRIGDAMNYKAWVAKTAKQPMVLETVDLGPLGAEDVEVAVKHCGLSHSDLPVFNNDWGSGTKELRALILINPG